MATVQGSAAVDLPGWARQPSRTPAMHDAFSQPKSWHLALPPRTVELDHNGHGERQCHTDLFGGG